MNKSIRNSLFSNISKNRWVYQMTQVTSWKYFSTFSSNNNRNLKTSNPIVILCILKPFLLSRLISTLKKIVTVRSPSCIKSSSKMKSMNLVIRWAVNWTFNKFSIRKLNISQKEIKLSGIITWRMNKLKEEYTMMEIMMLLTIITCLNIKAVQYHPMIFNIFNRIIVIMENRLNIILITKMACPLRLETRPWVEAVEATQVEVTMSIELAANSAIIASLTSWKNFTECHLQ